RRSAPRTPDFGPKTAPRTPWIFPRMNRSLWKSSILPHLKMDFCIGECGLNAIIRRVSATKANELATPRTGRQLGPKGPTKRLIDAVVEMKRRNRHLGL